MRSLARRLLVWPAFMLSLLVVGRLLFGRDFRLPTTTIVFHEDDGISIPSGSRTNLQQDSGPSGPPAYAAGMYMAGRRPRNGSACRWYYGLPDILSYAPSRLTWSPEIGEKSPYRYKAPQKIVTFILLENIMILKAEHGKKISSYNKFIIYTYIERTN